MQDDFDEMYLYFTFNEIIHLHIKLLALVAFELKLMILHVNIFVCFFFVVLRPTGELFINMGRHLYQ